MIFRNRTQAGNVLAEKLKEYAGTGAVLLAIPRGGVAVAIEIARETRLPLQLLYVRKIGHPREREYAIGVVGLEDCYMLPNAGIGGRYIALETTQIRKRLRQMQTQFGLDTIELKQRTAIIVVATPIAFTDAAIAIGKDADHVVCVQTVDNFSMIGEYYNDFHPLDDEEVGAMLQKPPHPPDWPQPEPIPESGYPKQSF